MRVAATRSKTSQMQGLVSGVRFPQLPGSFPLRRCTLHLVVALRGVLLLVLLPRAASFLH